MATAFAAHQNRHGVARLLRDCDRHDWIAMYLRGRDRHTGNKRSVTSDEASGKESTVERDTTRQTDHTLAELMVQDDYQPEDLAELLGIDVDVVRHAAFSGDLVAEVVGHTIVNIRRDDVLRWYDTRR